MVYPDTPVPGVSEKQLTFKQKIEGVDYSYLNHVESEFLDDEERIGETADQMLRDFFMRRKGAQSKAFTGDSLRYFVLRNGDGVEIIEEDGDWVTGEVDIDPVNDYERIYEENEKIKTEELEASEAEEYFSSGL